jgi:hypothetical protein
VVEVMNAKPERKVIPATPMYLRYRSFAHTSKGERRAQAEYFADDNPKELANQFRASVQHFESYENIAESFINAPHGLSAPSSGRAEGTPEVANRVAAAGTVVPRERTSGRTGPAPVAPVTCPSAGDLAFQYVERELTVTRTTHGVWEHGPAGRSRLDLDLLLVSPADRTPIAAEVKIDDDADRYYALIQALAAVASLATPNQCERMRTHLSQRGRFPETLVQAPRMDLYLLFVDSIVRGDVQQRIQRAVDTLASRLLKFNQVAWSVRRIVALEVDTTNVFDAEVRFAYERKKRPTGRLG